MKRQILHGFLILVIVAVGLRPAVIATAQPEPAIEDALAWLQSQQGTDGGFSSGFSPESSVPSTADVVVAAAAAGSDASQWMADGASPLDFLVSHVEQATEGAGTTAKLILAVAAVSLDTHDFAGTDLVAALNGFYDAESGQFQGVATDHMMAMLALANAGAEVPAAAVEWLESVQIEDGSWSFDGSTDAGAGDTNSTALAIQALTAGGVAPDSQAINSALDYLHGQQNEDGGFPYVKPSDFGTETDANSTAFVIQGLLAAGENLADWAGGDGATPVDALLALQIEDSGAFNWKLEQPGANLLATVQAIPALANMPLTDVNTVEAGNLPTAPETMPQTGTPAGPTVVFGMVVVGLALLSLAWAVRQRPGTPVNLR